MCGRWLNSTHPSATRRNKFERQSRIADASASGPGRALCFQTGLTLHADCGFDAVGVATVILDRSYVIFERHRGGFRWTSCIRRQPRRGVARHFTSCRRSSAPNRRVSGAGNSILPARRPDGSGLPQPAINLVYIQCHRHRGRVAHAISLGTSTTRFSISTTNACSALFAPYVVRPPRQHRFDVGVEMRVPRNSPRTPFQHLVDL